MSFTFYNLNTSLKITATTTWPGGSMTHSFIASTSIIDQSAYRLQSSDLDRLARYIAFKIFIDEGDELTELTDLSYEVL